MNNNVQWETSDPITILSSELNSFAAGQAVLSLEIDNSLGLYLFNDIELSLNNLNTQPIEGASVELYLVQSMDGINYESGVSDGLDISTNNLIGIFSFKQSVIAQRYSLRKFIVPPRKYKYAIKNKTGVAWANNGNTLKILGYRYKN